MRSLLLMKLATLSLVCASPPSHVLAAPTQSATDAATAFLGAFDEMDTARFGSFLAENITMFFPGGPFPPGRVEGKAAVMQIFHRFFAMAKERGAQRLDIKPLDLMAQEFDDFAIISFELHGNDKMGRRTIILHRQGADWTIIHFHASTADLAK